jgi:cysteine desulfurase
MMTTDFLRKCNQMIYLDYSATTPISDQALHTYSEVAKNYFGNPSSLHDVGSMAEQILNTCRDELAKCFNGEGRGVYFTSGGSESNDLAIRSLVKAHNHRGRHLITSQVEHSSILNTFRALEEEGYRVTYLPVNGYGEVLLDELEKAITPETILVSITHANSEIGTIQSIEDIGQLLDPKGILFHSDCVQTFGKVPLDVKKAKLDSISISGHKIYGPKGVGACYIAPEVRWQGTIPHTTHEKGFRPGTVNVPGIAGFVTAAQEIYANMNEESERCRKLTDQLFSAIKEQGGNIILEGHPIHRLPHHLGLRLPGMEGQYAMLEFNRYGIAVSTGSACRVGQQAPSQTMLAIGRSEQEARELIRITVGRYTSEKDIETTIEVFEKVLKQYYRSCFS